MAIPNKIIIITAPSGAGKTSITLHLMRTFPQLAFSISAATRQARGTEKDGVDYYFISPEFGTSVWKIYRDNSGGPCGGGWRLITVQECAANLAR